MNVLFLERHPRFVGGSERISLSLCGYLHGRGHGTHLLYETEGDMVDAYGPVTLSRRRAPVRPLAVRHPWEAAVSLRQLGRILRQERIDVMFTSQIGFLSLLAAARALHGVPAVVHLGLTMTVDSPLFRWGMRRVAAGITPSEPMREAWLRLGWPAAQLHVVPNAVDRARFHPIADQAGLRAQLALPRDRPVVAYLGRLVEEKGVFTLLRAAALLRERGVSFHLVIVGAAPEQQAGALADLAARLGLGPDWFSLRGPTAQPELFHAAADAVAVPSEWAEPFGLAAIEAMACGAVPVVSDAGILPQIVGAELSACVFPQGNAEELAARLAWVLTDRPARTSLGAAALARVAAHYDLPRFGAAYEQVLRGGRTTP